MDTESSKTQSGNRSKSDMQAKPQTEEKHPGEWQRDLSPDHMAGQNIGQVAAEAEQSAPNAHETKDVHRSLSGELRDDELKQIPILPEGQRLQQGARYMDLGDPERREFTATGDMTAGPDSRLVPKDEVPYSLWNRLSGVENPERLPERGER